MKLLPPTLAAALVLFTASFAKAEPAGATTKVPVVFSGGFETDPQDRGRPVVLIAAGLGVKPEVFRDAFSHVHPAGPGSGGPTEAEARQNKQALMSALGKYGITNDRLDEVSNHYRYQRSKGEMWRAEPATANALVRNGVVTGFEVTKAGAGYSSAPTVTVAGAAPFTATVEISFSKDLKKNGAVAAIKLAPAK